MARPVARASVLRLQVPDSLPVTPSGRRLLLALREHVQEDGWSSPSTATLATASDQSRSNVYRQLAEMERLGLLRRERRRVENRLRTGWVLDLGRTPTPAARLADVIQLVGENERLREEVRRLERRISTQAQRASVSKPAEVVARATTTLLWRAGEGPSTVYSPRREPLEALHAAGQGPAPEAVPLWPPEAPPLRAGDFELAKVDRLLHALRVEPDEVIETMVWHRVASLERTDQDQWWGLGWFSPGVFVTARQQAGPARAKHEARLAALQQLAQPARVHAEQHVAEDVGPRVSVPHEEFLKAIGAKPWRRGG